VKLLFDQNISHRLMEAVASLYPDSMHGRMVGLKAADDESIWAFARQHDFVIVSKDSDFYQRSLLFGFPPKVVWIRRGSCSTKTTAQILREHHPDLERFHRDKRHAYLVLT